MTYLSDSKRATIRNVLTPALMSSDEECDGGFITHQPSWQSEKFRSYKEKLDNKYKETCSTKSKKMLHQRTIGEDRQFEPPQIPDEQSWIIKKN